MFTALEVAGHSIAAGSAATSDDRDYAGLLAGRLGIVETNRAIGGGRAVRADNGWGKVLQEWPRSARGAPYGPVSSLALAHYGVNDLGWEATGSGFPAYRHAMRTILSRMLASAVFENTDASVAYSAGWTQIAATNKNSGSSYRRATANGEVVTITVPADYNGEVIALGLAADPSQGAAHTVRVDGQVHGTIDTRNAATAEPNGLGFVYRLTAAPGSHVITITADTVLTETRFDYWQIEAEASPSDFRVVLVSVIRILNWDQWVNNPAPEKPYDADDDMALDMLEAERSLAGEFGDNVTFVDVDQALNKYPPYFYDNAHLTNDGHAAIYRALYTAVASAVVVGGPSGPTWTFVVADASGYPLGELPGARDRSLSWRVNRLATASFSLRLDDPLGDELLDLARLVKVYDRDGALRFVGEPSDAEEVVDATTKRLGIVCQDAYARLGDRLIGKSTAGYTKTTPTDRGVVVAELLDQVNALDDTGIRLGLLQSSSPDYVGPWYYKPLAEAIGELSAALDGFDWALEPVEPVNDGAGLQIGRLDLYAARGAWQPDAVFAFSDAEEDRGNVKGYTRTRTRQGMLNTGYSLPPGFPDTTQGAVQSWFDGPARARWRWREGVIPGDMTDNALRLKLTQEHVLVRKQPREVIVVNGVVASELGESGAEHVPQTPAFKADYDIGDVVPFRATVDGQVRVNGRFRVYGVDLSIDDNGLETPTVSFVPEAA